MSTIAVTNLKHESASGNNITLDSSGGIGVGGVDTTTLPAFIDHAFEVQNGGGIGIHSANAGDNRWIFFGNGTSNADVQRAGIVNQGSDQSLGFATAGTQRLRIDSAGRVTMPYQPAFFVTNTGLGTSGPTATIAFNAVILNNGSHYSTTTNRFTAPVAGMYHFHFHSFIDTTNTSNSEIYLYKNGGNSFPFNIRIYTSDITSGYGPPISLQATVSLAANDYIEVYTNGLILHANDGSYFGGYLIG